MCKTKENKKLLSDITILDLTRVLSGPFSTMLLADLGANVIKIENPKGGDDTRSFVPFQNGSSVYFANLNRNKKSVTLNLKDSKAKEIFKEMVKHADVIVENYRPGVMKKLGLDYTVLKEINEKIVYASISGFGQYGPYSQRPGYDIIAQAMGGMMSINGQPGDPPTRVGAALGDILGGLNATIGILAALNSRQSTGIGQQIDVALTDSVALSIFAEIQRYLVTGNIPERIGNRYAAMAPYDAFPDCNGKEFIVGCGNQKLFETFCNNIINKPELITDPRFKTTELRSIHHAELRPFVEEWTRTVTSEEGVKKCLDAGIPSGPIFDAQQLTTDEHIAISREMYLNHEHPEIGKMTIIGNPIKIPGANPEIRTPAPLLGQHNKEIYGKLLGFDAKKLEELKQDKII